MGPMQFEGTQSSIQLDYLSLIKIFGHAIVDPFH